MSVFNSGVYQIKNKVNGKSYVGSSKDIGGRLKDHIGRLKGSKHQNIHLQRSWDKYGEDNFEFIVLELCSLEQLIEVEQRHMDIHESLDKGYNMLKAGSNGGHSEESKRKMSLSQKGRVGTPHTEESKRKMSLSLKGRKKSEETKERMRLAQSNRPDEVNKKVSASMTGHVVTEETRRKISETRKARGITNGKLGKPVSEETKRKISESLKGRKLPDEVKRKISEGLTGNKHSIETRKKMSESLMGNTRSKSNLTEVKRKISEALTGRRQSEETKKKISESMKGRVTSEETKQKRLETRRRNKERKAAELAAQNAAN